MKFISVLLCVALLTLVLAGCRGNQGETTGSTPVPSIPTPGATNPGTASTDSAGILENIWNLYGEEERFAVYGGAVEQAVNDAPGDLDITNTEELVTKFLLPQDQLDYISGGASLVHMMNGNIFTAVTFELTNGADMETVASAWRDAIGQNRWICGQPERLLMYRIDSSHILMAFGSADAMTKFESKTAEAFPDNRILYNEAIVG